MRLYDLGSIKPLLSVLQQLVGGGNAGEVVHHAYILYAIVRPRIPVPTSLFVVVPYN